MDGDHTHTPNCPLCNGTGRATHEELLKRLNIAYADGKREMLADAVFTIQGLKIAGPMTEEEMTMSPQEFVRNRLGRCIVAVGQLKEKI